MPELLLELGCEELPATFVRKAAADLHEGVCSRLRERGIAFKPGEGPFGTPRRLIVHLIEVAEEQPGTTEEKRGPSEQAAFDANGNPLGPLLGFCKGLGVAPDSVTRRDGYVWAEKSTPGRPTIEVLSEILPEAIASMSFEKSMRWGSGRMRFARPIRWILAGFGGNLIPFDVQGLASGLESRGHRFLAPESFRANTFDALIVELRNRFVEPDAAIREKRIRDGASSAASGKPDLPEALVDENVYLTEWPEAHEGTFKTEYLELPQPVLVTAMAKHQRFFPVRDGEGKLANRFIAVRGGGEADSVRQGNEWVLNARFNDARFFFEEDKRLSLEDFLEKTSGIVFQEKLGTVRARAGRLSALAAAVASATPVESQDALETEWAARAGLFAKADLSTGLVSELASLQGVVGGEYARREGFPDAVCWAIASHYDLDKNPEIACSGARTGVRLTVADQIDKLAGYLGLGLAPSGSSDPFGLRRAALVLIEAALRWPARFGGYAELLRRSAETYAEQGVALKDDPVAATAHLMAGRYGLVLEGYRHDVLEAAILLEPAYQLDAVENAALDPQGVRFRAACLQELCTDLPLVQTATRPINIVADAARKGRAFDRQSPLSGIDEGALDSATGSALRTHLLGISGEAKAAAETGDRDALCALLRGLQEPVHAFFEATMINAEDETARTARLNLANAACAVFALAGDFAKLAQEG